jgi:DNA polymerase-1
MGLPGGSKTKTGAWSTGAQVLDDLAEQGHEFPRKILDWRQVSKLRSTYTDALPNYVHPQTHRVHTSYALAATTTGRLSSNEPNLQNIPVRTEDGRKIRRAFIAADRPQAGVGRLLADRIATARGDRRYPVLKQAFQDGIDIHAMTASEMFGVPVEGHAGGNPPPRQGDQFRHHLRHFGLRPRQPAQHPPRGSRRLYQEVLRALPGHPRLYGPDRDFCREHGYVQTLFGRKCHYPDIKASNASIRAFNERAAINARLQGTAADIIRRAMTRMEDALAEKKLSAKMLLQVHDELIFEVPDDEVAATLALVTRVMENAPSPAVALSVPLNVDARAADNWDEAH